MIRTARLADAVAIAAVYAPYVTDSAASFEEQPPSAEEVARRMSLGYPWVVAEEDDVLGYAYAGPQHPRAGYRWSVTVSVYLAAQAHRRGIGRALYGALLPLLAELGYVRAFAGITLPNDASVGLHRAVGFTPVGVYHSAGFKHGRWHDVSWWERPLVEPLPTGPAEPVRWVVEA